MLVVDGIRIANTWAEAVAPTAPATPTAVFNPADAAIDVAVNTNITITFSEAVRNLDNSPITTPGSLITLKETNASGADIPFTATLDATNTIFTIDPTSDLNNSQLYYVEIAPVEDVDDNATTALNSTFTTIALGDVTPPVVVDAWAVDLNTVQVKFNEAMRDTSAEFINHYTGLAGIGSAVLNTTLDTVTLNLSTPLVFGMPDTVCIADVRDTSGNPMAFSQCIPVQYGILDVTPPTAISAWPVDLATVKVEFSEALDQTTAEALANYTGLAGIATATLNTTLDTVTLALSTHLISGVSDTLYIENVEDVANNPMASQQMFILLLDTSTTAPALVITEIMYNPAESGTDTTEFIEIYNNDVITVDLINYTLAYGASSFTFPVSTPIAPGEYVLVSSNAAKATPFYGISFIQGSTGGMGNSGATITLRTPSGITADSITYDDVAPWSPLADEGGYSLSLCDPNLDNNVGGNWSLGHNFFGTVNGHDVYADPGEGCTSATDTVAPIATHAWAEDFTTVKVRFNEAVETTSGENSANYTGLGALSNVVLNTNGDTATLTLSTPLVSGVSATLSVTGISDLSANTMSIVYNFPILLDTSTTVYNLVITEVMYNSPEAGIDSLEFIEIYNNDAVSVDLQNYTLMYGTSSYTFATSIVVNAGSYALIAPKATAATNFYGVSFIQGATGGISNSGTFVKLVSPSGLLVDSVSYLPTAPWNTAANGTGPSLTLCDPNSDNTDPLNWSVSTHFIGTIDGTTAVLADPGTACIITGISNVESGSISLYPNPAGNYLNIEGIANATTIEVFNNMGMLISNSNHNGNASMTLETTSMSNGLYYISIRMNDGSLITKPFVIVK